MKIDTYTMKELLAGDQYKNNKVSQLTKAVQEIINAYDPTGEISQTCGIHMATTLTNIFDRMEDKNSKPVQGVPDVLENFRKNEGNMENIAQVRSFEEIKGFLNKKGVISQGINFISYIKEEAANEKLKSIVKNLLKTYMTGKDFAPIGTPGDGHWVLLVKYDEIKNKILKLDSAPCEAKWISLDEAIERYIFSTYIYGAQAELHFFAKGKERKNEGENFNIYDVNEEDMPSAEAISQQINNSLGN